MLVLEMTPEHGLGECLQPNGTVVLSSGNATSGAGHGLTLRLHLCPVWLREGAQQREISLSDFGLFGHVPIKSDATAAIEMVRRLGLRKVRQ